MSEGVASYLLTPAASGLRVGPLGEAASRTGLKLPEIRRLPPNASEPADIALVWAPVGELPHAGPSDKLRKLADIRFVPFFSGYYGANRRAPTHFDELGRHRLITMRAYRWFANNGWAEWHRLLAAAEEETIVVDWSSALGFLIRGGSGIGILPTYAPMYSDGVLPLEVASPPMYGSLWMLCGENAHKEPAVQECYGILGKLFKAADWMNAAS
jgi:DNA-binding transcriptional LysR family regulator